ncbi:hypothetical protein JCM14469_10590 [Desulfatiferula olefinivorans]
MKRDERLPMAIPFRLALSALITGLFIVCLCPSLSLAVAPNPPGITSPANGSAHTGGEYVTFTGSCVDTEDGPLSGESLVWVSSKNGPIGTGQNFSVNTLKSGTHTITLTATDSESLTSGTSITITVSNNPPSAVITSPSNNSSFAAGSAVTFSGTGTDIDTGDVLSYSWSSTFGGITTVIGSQSVISVSTLAVGTHVIVLTVSDDQGGSTESTPITVTITNHPPTAVILSPPDNASFYPGDPINFNGEGQDTEDPESALSYLWSCNEHGDLSTSAAFTDNTLVAGYHTITFEVTDSVGAVNTATQSVTIFVGNHDPAAVITSPAAGTSYNMGQDILFQGSAVDTEDGALTGPNLVWTSNLEGATPIGTGSTFTLGNLSSGTHVITLTASDTYTPAGTGTASVIITVNNTFPTASISSPPGGSSFYPGTDITFSGLGNDAEDGPLSGASLVWVSSLSGQIGTGSPLVINTLPEGDHVITLTATDSSGASTDSDPLTITVGNSPPIATLTSPADGASFNQGATVTFRGTGTDTEDGSLTGAALTWTSSVDGLIGTGTILPIATLSIGTHTITLTVTDSQGDTDSTAIAITIINSAPVVTINSPPDGGIYETGTPLTLSGSAMDEEDDLLSGASLSWASSLDGNLGTGNAVTNVILSKGSHIITLTATDSEGVTGRASITVHIGNTPPTATIISPLTGTNFDEGEFITFTGIATDDEDGTLTGASLVWSSSLSGTFAVGATPAPINTLPTGRHTITLSATDSNGAVTYSTPVVIRVGNTLPVVTILSPINHSTFESGETISFEGTGVDAEDGVLLDAALVWTSSREGVIGTGTSLSLDNLARGEHTITLTATDNDGAAGSASITIKAQNAPPVATLLAPADGLSVNEGMPVTFQGTADDVEDGALTGEHLSWSSNLDGILGTGTQLSLETLTSGTHTVTLTATDNDGATDTAAVTLVIVPMTLSAYTLTVAEGEQGTITIQGGKSPYRVATRRSRIALPSEAGGIVTVLGVSAGSTVVTVTDNIRKAQEIVVTVTEADPGGGTGTLPDADAGPDQLLVTENATVTLSGRNLSDPTLSRSSLLWTQTRPDDPTVPVTPATVTLSDRTSPTPSFTVPLSDISGHTLCFQLTVTTVDGQDTDFMLVTIADNGIVSYPPGVVSFKSATNRDLGAQLVSDGLLIQLTPMDRDDIHSDLMPQSMIFGLISMKMSVTAGGVAVLSVHFPQAAPTGYSWFKYLPDQDRWIDFDRNLISGGTGDGAVFSADRRSVTLFITDDGPYDDNREDGMIEDPSGLGSAPLVSRPDSESDGGGGGGCFIETARP